MGSSNPHSICTGPRDECLTLDVAELNCFFLSSLANASENISPGPHGLSWRLIKLQVSTASPGNEV
jgi:hypothetical protein